MSFRIYFNIQPLFTPQNYCHFYLANQVNLYLFVISRELTYLYSPSYFCSMIVILPIGLLKRVRKNPDTIKYAIMLAGPCKYQKNKNFQSSGLQAKFTIQWKLQHLYPKCIESIKSLTSLILSFHVSVLTSPLQFLSCCSSFMQPA